MVSAIEMVSEMVCATDVTFHFSKIWRRSVHRANEVTSPCECWIKILDCQCVDTLYHQYYDTLYLI